MSQNFGHYKIICEVGRGGMGIIYKAEDPRLNRMVAIKQLILDHVDPDKKDEFRERFRREAILAAGLSHPNLISIYDVSISPENSYYVMELLEGQSLRGALERSPGQKMSADEFLPILKQTCSGLAHAHEMSLVHRDIKPDNIFLLPSGKVKLTDFGIARSAEADNSNLTKPGVMLGTLSYVSPEQLQDARNVDHRADIYSLAVVAYEALAGQVPFAGDGLTSTLMAIISKEAKAANEINPEISADVASVIAKAMRKKAPDRFQSVLDFEKEFERAVTMSKGATSGGFQRINIAGAGSSSTPYPGLPTSAGKLTPSSGIRVPGVLGTTGSHQLPGGEDMPKAVVKPWLAGRTGEHNRVQTGQLHPITQSVALVKPIGQIGKAGEGPGAFQEPASLCARGSKIVVGDTARRKFQVFSKDGRVLGESRSTAATQKNSKTNGGVFSKPSSVSIDSRGRIFAADSSDHYIRVFDGQGSFIKDFQNKHGKDGGILGLACDNAGNLFVADPDNGCIHVMVGESGTWMRKIGSKGTGEGQLQLPQSIALDRAGNLYVVDYASSKISVFSKAGMFQKAWGGKGTGKGEFNVPRGIAIDRNDRVYVADSLNHRIQVFSVNADYLYSFGGRGTEQGRFIGPCDLSIDPDSNILYVADRGNCRVQMFELLNG
ncbi:MAG: protein kinase [Candidatus Obscuribacterales bacterium]|nr:protein kinase [Candidatus Obscuribacterales bacterium]